MFVGISGNIEVVPEFFLYFITSIIIILHGLKFVAPQWNGEIVKSLYGEMLKWVILAEIIASVIFPFTTTIYQQ